MRFWTRKRRWRLAALAVLVAVLAVSARPAAHLIRTSMSDRDERLRLPAGMVNDASRLNETRVAEVWDLPADDAQAEQQLRKLLERAHHDGLHVSIAGARHSMGGQTI